VPAILYFTPTFSVADSTISSISLLVFLDDKPLLSLLFEVIIADEGLQEAKKTMKMKK